MKFYSERRRKTVFAFSEIRQIFFERGKNLVIVLQVTLLIFGFIALQFFGHHGHRFRACLGYKFPLVEVKWLHDKFLHAGG